MTICSSGCLWLFLFLKLRSESLTVDSSLSLSNVLFLAISVWLYICFELYTSVSVS